MDDKEFLAMRRDRSIATILGFKEKECDTYLPRDIQYKLRKVILDQLNGITDLAFDIIDDNINEEFLDRLERLEARIEGR